jgi:hypothetical protein
VLFNNTLSTNLSTWTPLATNIVGAGGSPFTSTYTDSVTHGSGNGFYVIQEQ